MNGDYGAHIADLAGYGVSEGELRDYEVGEPEPEADNDSNETVEVLRELIEAIDAKWSGETNRKRANAISPRMERAIDNAKRCLAGNESNKTGEGGSYGMDQ